MLKLHQKRVTKVFARFFPTHKPIDLTTVIQNTPLQGKYKCRIVYNHDVIASGFTPYQNPVIKSLKIVPGKDPCYGYKFANRMVLDNLYRQRGEADDIIIIRQGLVTDSYYANLAFFDGQSWWTPARPLLQGVKREALVAAGKLKKARILADDIASFTKVSLVNAMLDLGEVEVSVKSIMT